MLFPVLWGLALTLNGCGSKRKTAAAAATETVHAQKPSLLSQAEWDDLKRRYLTAYGRPGRIRRMQAKGVLKALNNTIPLRYTAERQKAMNLSVTTGVRKTLVQAENDRILIPRDLGEDERELIRMFYYAPLNGLWEYALDHHLLRRGGIATVNGRASHRYWFEAPGERLFAFYVDDTHHLIVRLQMFRSQRDEPVYTIDFMDFRPVSSVMIPYQWFAEDHQNGQSFKIFWHKIRIFD